MNGLVTPKTIKMLLLTCFTSAAITVSSIVNAAAYYNVGITQLQVTAVGSSYNTVYIAHNVTTSLCSGSNTFNRFAIVSDAQQSAVLAALMANKQISVLTTGVCNGGNIETVLDIRLTP